jgi:hypothetical protein
MRLTEAEYENLLQARWAGKSGATASPMTPATGRRSLIRQSSKGPNKTELRFLDECLKPLVQAGYLDEIGEHESITLRLANGLRYRPDWPAWAGAQLIFYEVKGARVWEDSLKSLKVAASKYRRFRFILCKYAKGEWIRQEVLP